ncbi:hypothetical protein ACGF5F_28770 [Streptomyces sp. NPDC047821]|uniref:hypothetical protein n=1 Tax=Streptomyces sp. NPDC047821 TaxID=3365488 RepID=UPI0037242596
MQQHVTAAGGFAYGVIGADIHVFGDGKPLYVLENRSPAPDLPLPAGSPYAAAQLAALRTWRDEGPRLAVRWLHGPDGPGGQDGRTRLAAAYVREALTDGWRAVTAVPGPRAVLPPPGSQDLRPAGARGLTLLVDHADQWPLAHLTWLFSNALLHRPGLPARVLLLAHGADAWPAVRAALANHQAGTSAVALAPLGRGPAPA